MKQPRTRAEVAGHTVGGLLFSFSLLLTASTAAAQQPPQTVSANELVRRVVAHEVAAANAGGHYMYRLRTETPRGSQTKDIIETRKWLLGRLVLEDDKPLPPEQRRKDDQRLRRLLTDPAKLRQKEKEEHENEQSVREMVKALPDAFFFEYAGTEEDVSGHQLARLTFKPKPKFRPTSRIVQVYQGMEGTMLVDTTVDRIVRVQARLVRAVNFGWGILGRLHRGGSFLLEQRNVGSGRWAMTILAVHFSGNVLLFKSIHIDSTSTASDFRCMPDDLTLEQGVELLMKNDQRKNIPEDTALAPITKAFEDGRPAPKQNVTNAAVPCDSRATILRVRRKPRG